MESRTKVYLIYIKVERGDIKYASAIVSDLVDWILERLINETRTRRGVIKKLKEMCLVVNSKVRKFCASIVYTYTHIYINQLLKYVSFNILLDTLLLR